MQTINCQVKLNDYHTGNKTGVTPTEAVILERIHKKESGGKCILNPVLAGDALTETRNKKGKVLTSKPRTNAEEVIRLKQAYNVRARNGAAGTHILDDLYPGVSPELPQTFEEVGIQPAAKPVAVELPEHPESEATIDEEPVRTPVANPPVSPHLKHLNELLAELAELEAIPSDERTKPQAKRLKELAVIKAPEAEAK